MVRSSGSVVRRSKDCSEVQWICSEVQQTVVRCSKDCADCGEGKQLAG